MVILKERILEILEQLPEEKIVKVLNFAESLNINEERGKNISIFRTAKLGKTKHFNRGELYNAYVSDRL